MRKIVGDESVFHFWVCSCTAEPIEVGPGFYQQSGAPICDDCGEDLKYDHTEIEVEEETKGQ